MGLDISHFAQVARHADGDRVVVLDGSAVRARQAQGFNGRDVLLAFKKAARARFGPCMKGVDLLEDLERTGRPLRTRHVRQVLAANQYSPGHPGGPAPAKSKPMHVLLVGGGATASRQVCAEIDLLQRPETRDHLRQIMALGGTYDIRTTIVEKQGRGSIGMGFAWNQDQEGYANNIGDNHPRGHEWAKKLYRDKQDELLASVSDSPPGRALFLDAVPAARKTDGPESNGPGVCPEPKTDRGATLRKNYGLQEHEHFESRLQAARKDDLLRRVYRVEVVADSEVYDVDTSSPLKPRVRVRAGAGGFDGAIEADVVRLATGTTTTSPLKANQCDVMRHAYIGPMSRAKLTAFLEPRGLLGDNGRLKPGARVLTGGTGLGLYDQLMVLDRMMGLTEVDDDAPLGYRVTEEAKRKYRGSILIASRTEGRWIAPRHTNVASWSQDLDPISNAREQHALFLHNQGQELFRSWEDILIATVAAAAGRTPAAVRQDGMTTEGLLALMQEETGRHLRAPEGDEGKTMFGARRQAYLSTVIGMGLERDFGRAAKAMGEAAPLTFRGRAGLLMGRAQLSAVTDPDLPVSANNRLLIDLHKTRMLDIASSPVLIHALAPELIEAGIARYTPGSYSGLSVDESGKRLSFVDGKGQLTKHDFFLVSPHFDREENPAEKSLAGKVHALDPASPSAARFGGNRMVLRDDGVPLNVESYGLGLGGHQRDEHSTVGFYAIDLFHKASIRSLGVDVAYRRLAEQHLAAAGRLDPVGDVEAMYREEFAGLDSAYRVEVEKFRHNYQEAMQKAAFVRIAERMSGNAAEFRRLYEMAGDPERRKELGGEAYLRAVREIPAFSPPGADDYFGRFVDFPPYVHQRVYERAFREARDALSASWELVA